MMLRKLSTATIIVAVLAAIPEINAEQPATTNRRAAIPSFRNEIMAVLSKSGCNLGTCHGNQHGKGGLKLSLRGQDPDADFVTLTRQMAGRRANVLVPDDSLLLRKPSMLVPHEGGRRFGGESEEYRLLRKWIVAGSPDDTDSVPPADRTVRHAGQDHAARAATIGHSECHRTILG